MVYFDPDVQNSMADLVQKAESDVDDDDVPPV